MLQSLRRQSSIKLLIKATSVVAIAVIGTLVVRSIHATTPTASIEPESGTVSNANVLSDAAASGGKAVQFTGTTTTGCANLNNGAKPDATNTGVPACATSSLTIVNGDQTYATDNAVISNKDIHGYVNITGKNITIKNSIIRGGTGKTCSGSVAQNSAALWVESSASNFTLVDSEVTPSNPTACMDGVWGINATLLRDNIHGSVDGIKAYDNLTIQDSYVHDLTQFASDPNQGGGETHNDAIQTYECNSNITIYHNNLAMSVKDNSAYQITQDDGVACKNISIDSNWLDGGGCTINVAHKDLASLTGVSITNNRFGEDRQYSGCTVLLSTKSTLSTYSNNVYDDTGKPVPSPQVHD